MAAVYLTVLGGCQPLAQKPIPLTAPPGQTAGAARPEVENALLVALAPVISPAESLTVYAELADYVGRQLGRPAKIVQRRTYADTNELIRRGLCDVAFVCTLAYVRGHDEFGMTALVAPQVRGKTTYRSYIIVPSDSPARSLEDLRGKSFAFVDPLSNTGWLSPVHRLKQRGETPERFFSTTIFTGSHDCSIRAVADRLVAGAAVDSLVYDYLRERTAATEGTRVLLKSEPYGIPPVVAPPTLNPTFRDKLVNVFLSMHRTPAGRKILAKLMIDRFVPAREVDYASVRAMAKERRPR